MALANIRSLALGAAHSLFLADDGALYGCGYMENGELIVDPLLQTACSGRTKTSRLLRLDIGERVERLACAYFVSIAQTQNSLLLFGESPTVSARVGKTRLTPPIF